MSCGPSFRKTCSGGYGSRIALRLSGTTACYFSVKVNNRAQIVNSCGDPATFPGYRAAISPVIAARFRYPRK